jgi:hypothetical protein
VNLGATVALLEPSTERGPEVFTPVKDIPLKDNSANQRDEVDLLAKMPRSWSTNRALIRCPKL